MPTETNREETEGSASSAVAHAIEPARTTVELVTQVMKAAGNDPQVKVAAHELGKAAVTLTKAINTFLIPLAVMNYAVEKARDYFQSQFARDFAEVAARIPPDDIVEPRSSLAGPLLQGLAFSHEEQVLKEMYLNLLASSMDRRTADEAHPAFVEIIKQMNSEEAHLLRSVIDTDASLPIAEIRCLDHPRWLTFFYQHFRTVLRHLQPIEDTSTGEPSDNPNISAITDNWLRLGLVQVDYSSTVMLTTGEDPYRWVESRPEFLRLREQHDPKRLIVRKGILSRTSLGKKFAMAVGIVSRGP